MAIVLQTETTLVKVGENFTLKSEYSGEVNPNVTFKYTLTVVDSTSTAIVGAEVKINGDTYTTDSNGQVAVDLVRGDYTATITKKDYIDGSDSFTILDADVNSTVTLSVGVGSFDDSYDNSFDDLDLREFGDETVLEMKNKYK